MAYPEKKPPIPLCSKAIASQHKLGKVKLVEWKKEQPGNKLVYHHYKWKAAQDC